MLASVAGKLVPIPINLDTINSLYGLDLDERGVEAFFAARREHIDHPGTSEDVIVSRVGRELYELFFRSYTRKQWGLDPSELDKSVTARIPTRTNRDDRYFTDRFMAMPRDGYTRVFERMLAHPNITVSTGTTYSEMKRLGGFRRVIYTGAIDEHFDVSLGKLPYRSLTFETVTHDYEWHQPVAVVNYPGTEPFTRVTEFKHLTGQRHPKTTLTYEYPSAEGDPYYPIPTPETHALYKRYEDRARATPGVWFVGRLATYRYYNMDQVVGQALKTFLAIERSVPRKRLRREAHALPHQGLSGTS